MIDNLLLENMNILDKYQGSKEKNVSKQSNLLTNIPLF